MLRTSLLELNEGQIKGLPKNPRFIRDSRFEKLRQSIKDAPEMLEMRQLIVVVHGQKYIVICGNMRLRACLDLGYKELPCYVLPESTPAKKLREYTIKDNIGYGETDWDMIANEWDADEVNEWGLDTPDGWGAPSRWGDGESPAQGRLPENRELAPNDFRDELPPELQGQDITPDDLPKLQGSDATPNERIIIVYPKAAEAELAHRLGLEKIDKVVYDISELFNDIQ